MIETYIAFVDNFKFAKQAIAEARAKPAFEKYYMVIISFILNSLLLQYIFDYEKTTPDLLVVKILKVFSHFMISAGFFFFQMET